VNLKSLIIKIIHIIIAIFSSWYFNYAQNIKGTVSDASGNPITAKILLKNPDKPEIISEFVLVKRGQFSYKLKKQYASGVLIEVTATGYNNIEEFIEAGKIKNTLNYDFVLLKTKIEKLDEVLITSKKRPFTIKEDTVTYNVDSYKDGTERKVEDLLKKLPGIEVDDATGNIKYKGKSIETVTLDGDNLFDYNYAIGTKNINIDLIEDIEAIENYSENKLLKGIENSDKVALNLKLKENKIDISGNFDIGLGDFPDSNTIPLDASLVLLGIQKSHKSFGLASYNNIGENSSSFNYYNNSITTEQLRESKFFSERIIPEYLATQNLNNQLTNINNQFFGNLNSIYNLSDKVKAKVNLFYLSDRIRSNQLSESNFSIDNDNFSTFDNNFVKKRPIQYRGDLELKFNTSKTTLLEYNISLRDEEIDTDRIIFSNQENDFNSNLLSDNIFLKQRLEFTKKLSSNKALQLDLINTINNLDQDFKISPSAFNSSEFDNDFQDNDSKTVNTLFKAIFLGKTNKKNKYNATLGFNLRSEEFNSNLIGQINEQQILSSSNDLKFIQNELYTLGSYSMRVNKFTITPRYAFRYLHQDLMQNADLLKSNDFIFEPSLDISYKIDKTSFIRFNSGINRNTQNLQNLYSNQILISNRIIKSNIPDITLQKGLNYGLLYSKVDLFNQLEITLGANFFKLDGNYFSNTEVNENSISNINFFLPDGTENWNFNFNITKLIPSLKTNVKLSSNHSINNFKNIVNNSDLQSNNSYFSNNSLFMKTSFDASFNFENKITYTFQQNKSENTLVNKSIDNNFKLLYQPSRQLFSTLEYNYFVPNLNDNNNNYSFLNLNFWYRPENKNWQLTLSGMNLLNENFFIERNISPISTNSFRTDLINRYFLLEFSYSI
jgi:hypothetical protein